ncbi:PREDICTED: uncharacterized protein LOC106742425 isoform X2 [Dinoponera quadriceps]|uniref:Uncharacterized protein LOC106742425 isoform X2 n=1 Tax=Dinoponera quadriceps TaxID=609295 RepID=A0A6P3WXG9_DINQU|nr:PREDICTED: uncharacterized protein LOC106742425 isoform X2 [Dinoponera quadriceps]
MATFDGSDDISSNPGYKYDSMDREYKIYVNYLPEEFNEVTIKEIFASCGKIIRMFYRDKATWAYITYERYHEAEHAIRKFHNKKPLYLEVAFAKDKSALNDEFQRLCISEIEEKPDKKPTSYSIGRGNTIRYLASPANVKSHWLIQDKEKIQRFPLSSESSVYRSDELYANTNRLWTRGLITVTEDGRRHVTLGRGFTKYEIPEPDRTIEEYIAKIYKRRQNEPYECSDDKVKNELQICIVCSAKTTKHCEKCLTYYYCSKACQVIHWPQHQAECERIPALVDDNSPAQVNTNESTKLVNTHINIPSDEVKLRRPNTPVTIGLNTQRNLTNKTNEDAVPINKPSSIQPEANSNVPTQKKADQPAVDAANRTQPISNRLYRFNSNESVDQSKKNGQFSLPPNHTRPSYYNRGYKNDATGKTTHDGETNENDNVRDKFNRDDRSYLQQRDAFQNGRRSSYNHRDTSNKQGPRLSTDAEKTTVVEVERQSDNVNNATPKAPRETPSPSSPNTGKLPSIKLPSLLDAIDDLLIEHTVPELEVEGGIEVVSRVEKNVYLGSLVLNQHTENMTKVLDDLSAVCTNMKEAANYRPQVGDLVCGEINTNVWRRGYVMTLSPDLRMIVVDQPKTVSVTKIVPCPKELLNICTFGVICEVNTELQENIYIINAVINRYNKNQGNFKAKLLIYNDNNEVINSIEALIKPWSPTVPKSAPVPATRSVPALAELKSGDKVCLINYRNHFTMFVHSMDKVEVEYANNILQRVAHCSQTAPRLSKPPHAEQMVIAPYNDGNKYRAMITEIQGDKAKIVYVDYGNFDDIDVKELQEIPDDLAIQRSCAAKLTLKDVPQNVPLTLEVDSYLRILLGKEELLTCTYDNKSVKDGVYLTTSTGERINDKIKQLLIPGWKKEDHEDKTCYMLNDIEIASLGRVGDIVDVWVLHKGYSENLLFMSPCDIDLIKHVTEVMPELMKEYCEKTEYYIPRKQELCVALYEGGWYRALCLVPRASQNTSEICFIDYGNVEEVEHKNVRLMPESFIKPQALANLCEIVNLIPANGKSNLDAVKQKLLELVHHVTKIKILECPEPGEYKVELLELRAALIQEGLISPSF